MLEPCAVVFCDLFLLEDVVGLVSSINAKTLQFGLLLMTALLFGVPTVAAQNTVDNDGLVSADGTLVPDFERNDRQNEDDLYEQQWKKPAGPLEPQDPLNKSYEAQSSQRLDERDNARISGTQTQLLASPLNEAPRDFRDDEFVYRLAIEAY